MITAILIASAAWFVAGMLLFFNPFVGKLYAADEQHPAVKQLPKNGVTMLRIFSAILIQCILWAFVYRYIKPALPANVVGSTVVFGLMITVMKMIPRDVDRWLLTTYPNSRMTIEFINGVICSFLVAGVFAMFI